MNLPRATTLLSWASRTFGPIALDPRERAMRFLEEATELAQSLGVTELQAHLIAHRVYGRPPGHPGKEFDQALSTLELLALVCNSDMEREAEAEMHRVLVVPQEEWDRRHAAKVAAGTATASNREAR